MLTGIGTVRQWWRLPRGERRLALEAAALAEIARLGLAVATVRTVRRALAWVPQSRRPWTAEAVERAVDRAAAARPRVSCLPESLGRAALLARHGHGSRLVVGFRSAGGAIAGHAWVERADGRDASAVEWPAPHGAAALRRDAAVERSFASRDAGGTGDRQPAAGQR